MFLFVRSFACVWIVSTYWHRERLHANNTETVAQEKWNQRDLGFLCNCPLSIQSSGGVAMVLRNYGFGRQLAGVGMQGRVALTCPDSHGRKKKRSQSSANLGPKSASKGHGAIPRSSQELDPNLCGLVFWGSSHRWAPLFLAASSYQLVQLGLHSRVPF